MRLASRISFLNRTPKGVPQKLPKMSTASKTDYDVVVIGAGTSGLYATLTLQKVNPNLRVLVVEANDYVGGRVKTDESFAPPLRFPLGAEFIHDDYEGHLLREYIATKGWELETRHWPNYYWVSSDNEFVLPQDRPEVNEMMQLLAKVPIEEVPEDSSLLDWLKAKGFSQFQINSIVPLTNDWGGLPHRVGMRDMVEMYKKDIVSEEGETYAVIKDRLLSDVIDEMAKEVREIWLNWPVTKINDKVGIVEVHGPRGDVLTCKKVIVTVSVNVLKTNGIEFSPPLPQEKTTILEKVETANLVKGHFVFDEAFWLKKYPDMWDVCCVGPVLVPEIWMKTSKEGHYITCYVALNETTKQGSYEEKQLLQGMLEQLDRMFGNAQDPRPATKHLVAQKLADWKRNPYIGGGYVYPNIGIVPGDKTRLAQPIGNIHFCGEAYQEIIDPCLQACMKSGQRAAEEAATSLNQSKL
eukprot:TRINITY_DN12748_c0_g1_i1.p1 TRINITY_DN12748_c0_g1~~TRINITY_DN12748_c0_g1_i1.p1  ORF type:complete len:467 (+),score=104.06 TRINITY_DN12748_c0_g1_i1:9-1409(+)